MAKVKDKALEENGEIHMERIPFRARWLSARMNMKPLIKDLINPHFKSPYAGLEQLISKVNEAFHPQGIFFTQECTLNAEYHVMTCRTTFYDVYSEIREDFLSMVPCAGLKPQDAGSAKTYARRYGLEAAVGVSGEKDDDGNAAQDAAKNQSKENGKRLVDLFDPANKSHKKLILDNIIENIGTDLSKELKTEFGSDIVKLMNRRPLTELKEVCAKYLQEKIMEE